MARYTVDLLDQLLDHVLAISALTFPTDLKLSYHLASTLVTAGTATDTTIEVAHAMTTGSKIVVDRMGASPETFYAGTVTENDNSPDPNTWTVELLDSEGAADALANNHDAGVYVSYDIIWDTSLENESAGGSYARLAFSSFAAAASVSGYRERANSAPAVFATNTDGTTQGLATHVCVHMDANDAFGVSAELDPPFEIVNGSALRLEAGTLKLRLLMPTLA